MPGRNGLWRKQTVNTALTFLHEQREGKTHIHGDNVDSVAIRFEDGSTYVVSDGYVANYVFATVDLPAENIQKEVFVPGEAPGEEGFYMVENSHNYCLLTMMFNRVIDIEKVAAVVLNGVELPVD